MLKMPGQTVAKIAGDGFTGEAGKAALKAEEGRGERSDDGRQYCHQAERPFQTPMLPATGEKASGLRQVGRRMGNNEAVDGGAGDERRDVKDAYAA